MLSFLKSRGRVISAAFASGIAVGIVGTGIAATSGAARFPDVQSGSYYDQSVGSLNERGIIKGNPDGTFNPAGFVTRADVAVMLQRLLVSIGEEDAESTGSARSTRSTSKSSSMQSSAATTSMSTASFASIATSPNGTVRFAAPTASIIENAAIGGITLAVVRTGGAVGAISVKIEASDGTAKTGEDYQPLSTVLTFAANETSKTVKLLLIDDTAGEGAETVNLTLSETTGGAIIGTPLQMAVTITDNEAPSGGSASSATSVSAGAGKFTLSAAIYGPAENAGTQTITVLRTDGSTGAANVNYATTNGTAISGTDYSSVSNSLTFASGETSKTFTLSVNDNAAIDGNRTFNLTLSNPSGGAALGDVPTAMVTIYDNETLTYGTGSLKFSKADFAVSESVGNALVTVSRVGGGKNRIMVSYATSNGSAISSSDYTATSGTLTFETGEMSKVIRVPIFKDEITDSNETINMSLSSPTGGATLIDPVNTVITIQ